MCGDRTAAIMINASTIVRWHLIARSFNGWVLIKEHATQKKNYSNDIILCSSIRRPIILCVHTQRLYDDGKTYSSNDKSLCKRNRLALWFYTRTLAVYRFGIKVVRCIKYQKRCAIALRMCGQRLRYICDIFDISNLEWLMTQWYVADWYWLYCKSFALFGWEHGRSGAWKSHN